MSGVSGAHRLLVADDDTPSRDLLVNQFEALGYVVDAAPDGNRALQLAMRNAYDLVILDVMMPMYDGIEVLRFLRRRYLAHPVRVIALTGDSSVQTRARAIEEGIDCYVNKPVDLRVLRRMVESLLADKRTPVAREPRSAQTKAAPRVVRPTMRLLRAERRRGG
jgi:DNA-binding response OmpR family regulator